MFKLNIPHSQCAPISFSSFHPYSRHRFVFHIFVLFGDHLGEWTSLVAQRLKHLPPSGNPGFDPWVGKIPWRRKWQPTPVFLPEESREQEEPGGLQSMGSQRVGHDSLTKHINTYTWSSSKFLDIVVLCSILLLASTIYLTMWQFIYPFRYWWTLGCFVVLATLSKAEVKGLWTTCSHFLWESTKRWSCGGITLAWGLSFSFRRYAKLFQSGCISIAHFYLFNWLIIFNTLKSILKPTTE